MSRFNVRQFDMRWLAPDSFAILDPIIYTAINGDVIECDFLLRVAADGKTVVRLYFVSDLGSIPLVTTPLVGDRCGKITLASIIHDWLYVVRKVLRPIKFQVDSSNMITPIPDALPPQLVDIDEAYADNLLYEMCRDPACSENEAEAEATYIGVRAGGRFVWGAHGALDLNAVTPENPTENFVAI